jgi:hypothetical protein
MNREFKELVLIKLIVCNNYNLCLTHQKVTDHISQYRFLTLINSAVRGSMNKKLFDSTE